MDFLVSADIDVGAQFCIPIAVNSVETLQNVNVL